MGPGNVGFELQETKGQRQKTESEAVNRPYTQLTTDLRSGRSRLTTSRSLFELDQDDKMRYTTLCPNKAALLQSWTHLGFV